MDVIDKVKVLASESLGFRQMHGLAYQDIPLQQPLLSMEDVGILNFNYNIIPMFTLKHISFCIIILNIEMKGFLVALPILYVSFFYYSLKMQVGLNKMITMIGDQDQVSTTVVSFGKLEKVNVYNCESLIKMFLSKVLRKFHKLNKLAMLNNGMLVLNDGFLYDLEEKNLAASNCDPKKSGVAA